MNFNRPDLRLEEDGMVIDVVVVVVFGDDFDIVIVVVAVGMFVVVRRSTFIMYDQPLRSFEF